MSTQQRKASAVLIAIVAVIGCGGGKPQEEPTASSERPLQVAQATGGEASHGAAPGGGMPAGASGAATITGTVKFDGSAPAAEPVQMAADPACQQQHSGPVLTEDVVVNTNGTLKNVVVYVKTGLQGSFPAPTQPVVLDQVGCWYKPHVFGIQTNQPLKIVNSDATLHNINAKTVANQPFNVSQPVKVMKTTKKFAKPEVGVKFKCNVHPWMNAHAVVVEHPFFSVSDDTGNFSIAGLADGTYTLEAWHETYGTQTKDVTVAGGQATPVEFTFKGQ